MPPGALDRCAPPTWQPFVCVYWPVCEKSARACVRSRVSGGPSPAVRKWVGF